MKCPKETSPLKDYFLCNCMLKCYIMLCYAMLCHVMSCHVMLCYVMLCYVMLCYVMLCHNGRAYAWICPNIVPYIYKLQPQWELFIVFKLLGHTGIIYSNLVYIGNQVYYADINIDKVAIITHCNFSLK